MDLTWQKMKYIMNFPLSNELPNFKIFKIYGIKLASQTKKWGLGDFEEGGIRLPLTPRIYNNQSQLLSN